MFDLNWNPYGNENLLDKDGEVFYYGKLFDYVQSQKYLSLLQEQIEWKSDEVIIYGKKIVTKRQVAWYGDFPFKYQYSNSSKIALPFTTVLNELRTIVEGKTGETYNSCLLNLYPIGDVGMGWHSDDERELKKNGSIASLSFGEERKFSFKHKKEDLRLDLRLENGSLLEMKGEIQSHWMHALPASKKINGPRINLTFRTIVVE